MASTPADLTAAYAAQLAPGGAGLVALRRAAMERFGAAGIPGPRDENWRYTNLARAMGKPFAPVTGGASGDSSLVARWGLGDIPHHRMVFVNGAFAPQLSDMGGLPAGVSLVPLSEAASVDADWLADVFARLGEDHSGGLAALNTALMRDGAVLRIADNVGLDLPLHLLHVADQPGAVHGRTVVVAGANCRARFIETFAGADGTEYWCNAHTGIVAGPGAALGHVRLQRDGGKAVHTGAVRAILERDSRLDSVVLSVGASLARNDVTASLVGSGAAFNFSGGVLARDRQHGDITTRVEHLVPHCRSGQVVRNVLDDRGRGVFQGSIVVAPDAQKTAADQSSRCLLLSERAHADTKPELRIFADDVKCSHGATVGDLDDTSLFYLRSRGIPADEARNLLVGAFVAEIVEAAPVAREHLDAVIAAWLGDAR